MKQIRWEDIFERIERLPREHTYYGIPRGGATIAGVMAARGFNVTLVPEQATALVDDIEDSGATRQKWNGQFKEKDWYALYERGTEWLVFPWEGPAETDAEDLVRRQLQFIGEDPTREGLRDTPRRVVASWRELFAGYKQDPKALLNARFDHEGYDQMVISRNNDFHSTCEHHLLPFTGVAHIGYIPKGKIVGLSKMARLVECYARRLQIQERMTQQIANAMEEALEPKGVAVMIEARHLCMACRGVAKQRSDMVTTCLRGNFSFHAVRDEFLSQCQRS